MLNFEEVKEIAEKKLTEIEKRSNIKLVLIEEGTIPFTYGWVFFYQSYEFVSTGDINALVGGNAPILIDKYDGAVYLTGTSKPVNSYIEEYIAKNINNALASVDIHYFPLTSNTCLSKYSNDAGDARINDLPANGRK